MSEIVLEAREVSKHFGGVPVVDGVSLQIARERIVTLIGPNGSGKTTLLKLLLGLEKPDSGSVYRKLGLHIGYVPQRLSLDVTLPMTAGHFLRLHAHHRPAAAEVKDIAETLGIAEILGRQLAAVSGGELQRLLLARALLCRPELLVLDEPAQGVDVEGQARLYALIAHMARQRRLAVLMVSHDLHFVMSATDEVICLHHHVCCAGHPHAVQGDPEFVALFGQEAAASLAVYTHHHSHSHS